MGLMMKNRINYPIVICSQVPWTCLREERLTSLHDYFIKKEGYINLAMTTPHHFAAAFGGFESSSASGVGRQCVVDYFAWHALGLFYFWVHYKHLPAGLVLKIGCLRYLQRLQSIDLKLSLAGVPSNLSKMCSFANQDINKLVFA